MSTTAPDGHSQPMPSRSAHPANHPLGVLVVLTVALFALLAPVAMPASYSWSQHGVSESAAQGIEGAWVTRSGFLLLGLAVLWLARLRHHAWKPVGTTLHGAFAVSMFAVAAFSARPWQPEATYVESEDLLHSVFATIMGFGFIIGVAAVLIARRPPTMRAALPDVAAIAIPSTISLTMSTSIWGLLQRIMFLTAAAWYGREAILDWRQRPEGAGRYRLRWTTQNSFRSGSARTEVR